MEHKSLSLGLPREQTSAIKSIVQVFETGSPFGKYDQVTVANDGPHSIKQISYGTCQAAEFSSLRSLLSNYLSAPNTTMQYPASEKLLRDKYIHLVGNIPLAEDESFIALLKKLGSEEIMRTTQDNFFHEKYYVPAQRWAFDNGFVFPLSVLVIYDSFIHSGSILWLLRSRFVESPPSDIANQGLHGGMLIQCEKAWIEAYVKARHEWLTNHKIKILRKTNYRTAFFLKMIQEGNWDLKTPITVQGVTIE